MRQMYSEILEGQGFYGHANAWAKMQMRSVSLSAAEAVCEKLAGAPGQPLHVFALVLLQRSPATSQLGQIHHQQVASKPIRTTAN